MLRCHHCLMEYLLLIQRKKNLTYFRLRGVRL
ncbi:hypothetical protein Cocul_00897 [Corynebacterium oculi]|uniref:Uncharacterized protein n=1 Tax=Corynebacterium oculi TaxID=1544416 RepID=A0A0Q0Z402_9CORY|nr:hypothetical protein Cocul_00897 [Corynebacterium oculi]